MKILIIGGSGLTLALLAAMSAQAQDVIKPDGEVLKVAADYKARQARIQSRNDKTLKDNQPDIIGSFGDRDFISSKVPQGYTFNLDALTFVKLPAPPAPVVTPAPPTPTTGNPETKMVPTPADKKPEPPPAEPAKQ